MNKLTKKQEAFIYHRARGHTLKDSIFKAGYKLRTDDEAMSYGSTLAKRFNELIEQEKLKVFDKNSITEEYIVEELNKIIHNERTKSSDRIKCLELLGRWRSMFTDKIDNVRPSTINMQIVGKDDKEIRHNIRKDLELQQDL